MVGCEGCDECESPAPFSPAVAHVVPLEGGS